MELRHIRYFLAIAQEKNFTSAARRLGIGQPALSQQIRGLEAEIGAPLFHRVPHGAEITAAGTAFLNIVHTIPEQVQVAVRESQRAAAGQTGAVRVGFTGSAVFNPHFTLTIRTFRRLYPSVDLSLSHANSNELVAALHDARIDVAFLRPDAVSEDGLRFYQVDKERMIAAVPAGRMPHRRPLKLAELKGDPFIMTPRTLGPTLYDATIAACETAGFTPVFGQSAPQVGSMLALVAADLGVALVPESMREVPMKGVTYHTLVDVRAYANLAIAMRRDERSPTITAFVHEARFCGGRDLPPAQAVP